MPNQRSQNPTQGEARLVDRLRRNRWLLTPIISWQARRLAKKTGMNQDDAWQEVRKTTHPEEDTFRQHHQL